VSLFKMAYNSLRISASIDFYSIYVSRKIQVVHTLTKHNTLLSFEIFHSIPSFGVFTAVTMKNAVFWDTKKPVHTSHEAHNFFATEPSLLTLCKI
jgi:hypothetical protein